MTLGETPKLRVLIVDDDYTQSLLLKVKLAKLDYVIATAGDGTDALCKIHTFKPDVVLLDVNMPGLTGNELIRTFLVFRPGIKIIVLTAFREQALEDECIRKGAFSCMWKPLVFDELRDTIQAAVELGRLPQNPVQAITDTDMAELEFALKVLEKQGVMSRAEVLEELRKIRGAS